MRFGMRVGEGCARLRDTLMCDLQVNLIECDEQWDFITKKQWHVKQEDPTECGDVWFFVALAATQKLRRRRTPENTETLAMDLHSTNREPTANYIRWLCAILRCNRKCIRLERRLRHADK